MKERTTLIGKTFDEKTKVPTIPAEGRIKINPIAKITLYKLSGYGPVEEEIASAFLYGFEEGFNMVTVGRKDTCELQLPIKGKLEQTVSGEHCTIRVEKTAKNKLHILVTDISSNGTYVNDERGIGRDRTMHFYSGDDFFLAIGNNIKNYLLRQAPRAYRIRCEITEQGKRLGLGSDL